MGVRLIMRGIALRAPDDLFVEPMHKTSVDTHDHCLIGLIAYHRSLHDPFRHDFNPFRLGSGALAGTGLHRLNPRDIAPDFAHSRGVFQLAYHLLKAQVKGLLLQIQQLFPQLIRGHTANFFKLHHLRPFTDA